jgi:hypothetical protein
MAGRKPSVKQSEKNPQAPRSRVQMTESSPNPHNEADVQEVPVRTDRPDDAAEQNVAQTASTRDGRLHPSVAEATEGGVADHDSMFNNADPQAREVSSSGVRENRDAARRQRRDSEKKSA